MKGPHRIQCLLNTCFDWLILWQTNHKNHGDFSYPGNLGLALEFRESVDLILDLQVIYLKLALPVCDLPSLIKKRNKMRHVSLFII